MIQTELLQELVGKVWWTCSVKIFILDDSKLGCLQPMYTVSG